MCTTCVRNPKNVLQRRQNTFHGMSKKAFLSQLKLLGDMVKSFFGHLMKLILAPPEGVLRISDACCVHQKCCKNVIVQLSLQQIAVIIMTIR